ncbi:MAG: tetratricopeptide repeat protein [Bacteroidales bacterium]
MKPLFPILFLFFSFVWVGASASSPLEEEPAFSYSVANESYRNGDFAKAADEYQRIIDAGWASADLYFNMGNACQKLHRRAEAILYYERALRLRPNDEDIRYNLEWVSSQVKEPTETLPELFIVRWAHSLRNLLPEQGWAVLVIVCLLLLLGTVWGYLFLQQRFLKKASFSLSVLFASMLVVSVIAGSSRKAWMNNRTEAVVKTEKLTVYSAPDQNSTQLFLIFEGIRVNILDQVGDWREIRLPDGNKGWIRVSDILVI